MVNDNRNRWKPGLRLVGDPRDGDPAADARNLGRRLLPHLDEAYRYARYLSRNESVAEDIVQEAFLRALKAHASCRGAEKPWLFAIVRNCYIDWSKTNRGTYSGDPADLAATLVEQDTPETQLQSRLDTLSVRDAIAGLPEPFREAIILRELDALSYREIATITDAPIGTVMSRLARGRVLLAALFLSHDRKEGNR